MRKLSPPSKGGRVVHLCERRMQGNRRVFPFPQVNGMSVKRFTCGGGGGNGGGLRDSEAVVSRWRETDGSSPKYSGGILAAGHRRSGYSPCLSIEQEACVYHVNWPILETGMSGKGSVWKPAYLEKRVYLEEQACPGGKTSLYGESGISRETGLPEETCFKKEKPTTKSLWGRPLSIVSVLFVLCRSFWAFWAFGTFSVLLRYVIGA